MNTVADNTTRFPDTLDAVQYQGIVESMPPPWHVFTDFLVISGARLGEAAALTDTDLDPDGGACRIHRIWRSGPGGWVLADAQCPRTIAVPQNLFGRLSIHGSGEELFRIDGACGPELITLFVGRVWRPAVDTVADDRLGGRRPAVAALRTTCALWLTDTGASWPVIATHLGYRDNRSTLAQHAHITPERDRA